MGVGRSAAQRDGRGTDVVYRMELVDDLSAADIRLIKSGRRASKGHHKTVPAITELGCRGPPWLAQRLQKQHRSATALKFGEVLGSGLTCTVLQAQVVQDGTFCAVKCIDCTQITASTGMSDESVENRLQLELTCLRAITQEGKKEGRCPFIVPFFGAFEEGPIWYICQQFCAGGELLKRMRGRMAPAVAKFYCSELLLALQHIHSLNFLFRDVKPGT